MNATYLSHLDMVLFSLYPANSRLNAFLNTVCIAPSNGMTWLTLSFATFLPTINFLAPSFYQFFVIGLPHDLGDLSSQFAYISKYFCSNSSKEIRFYSTIDFNAQSPLSVCLTTNITKKICMIWKRFRLLPFIFPKFNFTLTLNLVLLYKNYQQALSPLPGSLLTLHILIQPTQIIVSLKCAILLLSYISWIC